MKDSAVGHDGLPLHIFRDNIDILGDVLAHLFCLSLSSGIVPGDMMIGRVVCIYKSDDPKNINNYRPISILPVLSQILEKLVYSQVMDHLVQHNYLSNSQYGFRTQCSTEGALHDICTSIYDNFEEGNYCLGFFLDLRKAFDSLDRGILLEKLAAYGITGNELSWFTSYFRGRQQYVVYKNKPSSRRSVNYGTPQGSVLGPLLFLLYVNDIVHATNQVKFILFADDTNMFFFCK